MPALLLVAGACAPAEQEAAPVADTEVDGAALTDVAALIERSRADAQQIMRALQPIPLLTPVQEARLRRSSQAAQLARAQALGTRVSSGVDTAQLSATLGFERLPDSTATFVVRALEHSVPYATPATRALLESIGARFQERLRALELPALRVEVTSVLRTPDSQEELRRTNANAAAGASTHEFGTSFDITYASFPAPLVDSVAGSAVAALAQALRSAHTDAAAARMSRELQALLGEVLIEMENEGALMVTLERQQPVFHVTLGGG